MRKLIGVGFLTLVLPMLVLSIPHATIVLSPTTLTFPPQVVNPTAPPSAPQSITVHNRGNKAGSVGPIAVTGPYSQTNNCPASLAASASCVVQVSFAPNAVGGINGVLHVGPPSAALSGTGLAPVGLTPTSLDFGTVPIGTLSAPQTVTLTNNQSDPLAISAVSVSGDYSQTNTCPASLGAGASCTVSIHFQPTVKGSVVGAVSVSTDAALAAQPVGLTGVGSGTATPMVSLSPANLDFGSQEAGTTSAAQIVTLKNTNAAASLTISSVAISSGYTSTDTCAGKIISPNGTCTISVKFEPTANLVPTQYPGAITITDGDTTSPQVVGLSGSGVAPVYASLTALDFGTISSATTTAPQTVTFQNSDSSTETLSVATQGLFAISNNTCPSTLAVGGKCSVQVTFGPAPFGPASGAMTADFSSGGFLNPQVVDLTGCVTEVNRTPASLNFGAVAIGKLSDPETVTITGGAFNFTGFTLSGTNTSEFAIANNTCGNSLSSGSCTVELTFTPAAAGARSASLAIADDQHCSPQSVKLSGGSSAGPFVLTGIPNGTGSGTLTSNPAGLVCGSQGTNCSANFATGTAVTVMALPDSNSTFGGWSGACTGTTPCNLTMSADRQVTGTFNLNPLLTVSLGGNISGTGTVTSTPAGIRCQLPQGSSACSAYFPPGTSVQLTATAGSGSVFAGWNGACSGTSTCALVMNADTSVGATFNGPPTLSVSFSGTGGGTVTSTPAGINCPAAQCSFTYPSGTAVTLAAAAGTGSGFDGWSGPCSGTGSCAFHITSDQNVVASFDLPDFALSVSPSTPPTLAPGGRASFNVGVGSLGGFTGAVALSCSAPTAQGVNCSLSSASVQPGGTATLMVTTTGPSSALTLPRINHSNTFYATWILFPALAVFGIGTAGGGAKKRRLWSLLSCFVLLAVLTLQMACSSGGGITNPGTPAGTYTVNLNATSGNVQHSSPVSITVQ